MPCWIILVSNSRCPANLAFTWSLKSCKSFCIRGIGSILLLISLKYSPHVPIARRIRPDNKFRFIHPHIVGFLFGGIRFIIGDFAGLGAVNDCGFVVFFIVLFKFEVANIQHYFMQCQEKSTKVINNLSGVHFLRVFKIREQKKIMNAISRIISDSVRNVVHFIHSL